MKLNPEEREVSTQYVKELTKLMNFYPEARVVTLAHKTDESDYGTGSYEEVVWEEPTVEEIYEKGFETYVRRTDEMRLANDLVDELIRDNPGSTDTFIEEELGRKMEAIKWKQVILLKITQKERLH